MKIGLIDVDGHNYPNLALMKLSAWHKSKGDSVEWWWTDMIHYDLVYMSKVFSEEYSPDIPEPMNADRVVKGGTGYDLENVLLPEIEHIYPDYSLYPKFTKDTAYGFLTRGCPRGCHFCIVAEKEGRCSVKVADLSEWWNGQKNIVLMDPNLLACKEHLNLLSQLINSGAWVDVNQGFDCRLLTPENIDAINRMRVKEVRFAWDYMKETNAVLSGLRLYAKQAKHRPHGNLGTVYTLTNFDTTMEENLYRIYTLLDMGYDPYVMIYNKPSAPKIIRQLQRWCNNKRIFRTEPRFENYHAKGA